jgi:hypothetical protein
MPSTVMPSALEMSPSKVRALSEALGSTAGPTELAGRPIALQFAHELGFKAGHGASGLALPFLWPARLRRAFLGVLPFLPELLLGAFLPGKEQAVDAYAIT